MTKEQFKELRLKMSLTQKKLGWLLGLHSVTISGMERGSRPIETRVKNEMTLLNFCHNEGTLAKYLESREYWDGVSEFNEEIANVKTE